MSMGNLPESLSQTMLVGIMLVGRLGVGREAMVRWLGSVGEGRLRYVTARIVIISNTCK